MEEKEKDVVKVINVKEIKFMDGMNAKKEPVFKWELLNVLALGMEENDKLILFKLKN